MAGFAHSPMWRSWLAQATAETLFGVALLPVALLALRGVSLDALTPRAAAWIVAVNGVRTACWTLLFWRRQRRAERRIEAAEGGAEQPDHRDLSALARGAYAYPTRLTALV